MDRATDHTCPICSLSFSRKSHLQRHYDTHTPHKAWKCDFCASRFKRSDALRKHWKSCALGKIFGEATLAQLPPGRKRHACDRCAANKQGCDQGVPCSNCVAKTSFCSYERASSINTTWNRNSNPLDVETWNFRFSPIALCNSPAALSTEHNDHRLHIQYGERSENVHNRSPIQQDQIGFIIQLTTCHGLHRVFNYTSPSEHTQNMLESNMFDSLIDWQIGPWREVDVETPDGSCDSGAIPTARMASWISHTLFSQSTSIWSTIQENPLFQSSDKMDAQHSQDHSHIEFFNPFNLERYLGLFWDRWTPHCPIIHKASLDIKDTPIFMLLVMVLIGCCMSDNPEDVSNARKWLDITEWNIFQQLSLWSTLEQLYGQDPAALLRAKLRLLQSALLVCTVQHWEGLKESKERIKHEKFPAVVAAARDIGFDLATHNRDINMDQRYIDWPRYILTEELIRTHTLIFLFDHQYALFHGIPPRTKLAELQMTLPSPESCFKASTGDEVLMTLETLGQSSIRNESVRNLVELLCSEKENPIKLQDMAGISFLGLITLVVGQFNLEASCSSHNANPHSFQPSKQQSYVKKCLFVSRRPRSRYCAAA
ncbi:hypothetical protein C7974DRAFT_395147 [Boeremia exigua]|uniref:uncharacterized protein n=1 Tax=Boeremia exigua TaxID=749465 RepID=UPI001E8DAAD2|nr:uncharacterized protein C7974DRAFT_395147 [Boeremia exigua]KAH6629743.1 hypothetical protein C7974DRAFT_395147 [Boeremia exigua]